MVLALADHRAMLAGFEAQGFSCARAPTTPTNPVRIEWHNEDQVRRFRLWAFDITHGGGGSTVRAADEFRIQITNGPPTVGAFDSNGATDLLLGYSRDRDAIVAYDRRWLEGWTRKKVDTGSGGSPSVQVKEADIQAGHDTGIHHLTKTGLSFGEGHIVTMNPSMLPAYLLNHDAVLRGTMTAEQAGAVTPRPGAASVVEYCRIQGFPFEPDLIARYLASFQAKPFVILAGVSGTGKSKLAELVAEFYCTGSPEVPAAPTNVGTASPADAFVFTGRGPPDATRFALVPVRPDWIDSQSILGFVNPITDRYESTQALDLILRAHRVLLGSTSRPLAKRHFMLLDEMNLARVEHYFSDWLACTESRRPLPDGSIRQQPVPLHRADKAMQTSIIRQDGTIESIAVPASLDLPTNLVVTGTVNVDETTYGFSPKVLDRAMVIEFDDVNLDRLRSADQAAQVGGYRFPEALRPFALASASDYRNIPARTHQLLTILNGLLEEARLHFGYRSANEMALFMSIYNDILPIAQDPDWLRALDVAVLQKVLPRLTGNRAKLEAPLAKVCSFLRDLLPPADNVAATEFDEASPAVLKHSYRRSVEMLQALRDFGFVSFFK